MMKPNQTFSCDNGKSDTNKCTHVLKFVASPPDDVSQAEDWTVGGDLLIIAASPQIVHVSRVQNIRPLKAKLVINRCVLIVMASWNILDLLWKLKFGKLDEVFDVYCEVFSFCQLWLSKKNNNIIFNHYIPISNFVSNFILCCILWWRVSFKWTPAVHLTGTVGATVSSHTAATHDAWGETRQHARNTTTQTERFSLSVFLTVPTHNHLSFLAVCIRLTATISHFLALKKKKTSWTIFIKRVVSHQQWFKSISGKGDSHPSRCDFNPS